MSEIPQPWREAAQADEQRRRERREALIRADLEWQNHVADALLVAAQEEDET